MKKAIFLHYSFLIFSSLLFSLTCFAQQRKISGIVQDSKNNTPLDGATVSVKNSKANAITKEDGRFEVNIPDGKETITVSFVGYETKTINIGANQTSVIVSLTKEVENKWVK